MSNFDSDYCCLCFFISFFSFSSGITYFAVYWLQTLFTEIIEGAWFLGNQHSLNQSLQVLFFLLTPPKTLKNSSFTHSGHLPPLVQGAGFISLRTHEHSSLLSHSVLLPNWLEETKKPKRCSFYENMTDGPLWLSCCGVKLVLDAQMGRVVSDILAGGRRRHRATCLLQVLVKSDS